MDPRPKQDKGDELLVSTYNIGYDIRSTILGLRESANDSDAENHRSWRLGALANSRRKYEESLWNTLQHVLLSPSLN